MHHDGYVKDQLRDHVLDISGQPSVRALALDIGMEPSTLARQISSGDVKVQTVVSICRHYNAPLLPSFVAAGFITPDEAAAMSGTATLASVSDRELAEEILRRATSRPESSLNTGAI